MSEVIPIVISWSLRFSMSTAIGSVMVVKENFGLPLSLGVIESSLTILAKDVPLPTSARVQRIAAAPTASAGMFAISDCFFYLR